AEPSTAASTAPETVPQEVWHYSVPVPGSKKNKLIYIKAPFELRPWTTEQWQARFVFVKNQLEDLVYKYLRLLDFEKRPAYHPRMVGTCPSDARPSVVIICREADAKHIQSLFRTRAEEKLCLQGRESAWSQFRSSFGTGQREAQSEQAIPRLQLVYYRTRT
ncbi:hypothetical protein B0H67DRAFT_462863, partial [Lasiosphaeris hirsuta]